MQGTLAYCLPRQISCSAPISSVRGGVSRPLSFVSSFAGKIAAAHFCAVPGRCREPGRVLTASRAPGGRPPADGPSMLIDIEDGRPTEGEHTIGDLTERASLSWRQHADLERRLVQSPGPRNQSRQFAINHAGGQRFSSIVATFSPCCCRNVTVENRRCGNFCKVLTACIGRSRGSGHWVRGGITE